VVFAETLEELGDITEIAARCPALPGGGTAVLGESGAFKALTLDLCEGLGVALPALDDANAPALRAAMPEFVGVSNPLDITAQGLVEPDMYYRLLKALGADDRFGCVVAGIILTDPATVSIKLPPILRSVEEAPLGTPLIFAGLDEGAPLGAENIARLRAAGVPCFGSTERVFRAIARLSAHAARDFAICDADPLACEDLPLGGVVPEYRAKAVLAPLGLPFPRGGFARTADEAVRIADEIGYPVVLKAQSAELSHKSDAGGVVLNLADEDGLRAGWRKLHGDVGRHRPDLTLDGVLVEGMGKRGVELIVGAKRDPEWGPVILAGFGGVTAEILQDVRLLPCDLTPEAIERELHQLKSAAILRGWRGAPALDVPAVAALIARLAQVLIAEPSIREVDLNPVVVHPLGEGVVALDALMLTA